MRKPAFGTLLVASLITVGAGCASTPAPEPAAPTYPGYQAPAPTPEPEPAPTPSPTSAAPESGVPAAQAAESGDMKTYTVTAENFAYDLKEIKVKKGEKVSITFKNAEGFHDFKIDEYDIATQKLQAGGEQTIQFTADKAGTFEYYCSVGKHRQMGMKGNLVVE